MGTFSDVTLDWDGDKYTIPANRVMKAIAVIEGHLTLKEIHDMMAIRQTIKMATIAEAMAALLAWMGVKSKEEERKGQPINAEEVYSSMFIDAAGDDPAASPQILTALMALLAIMTPPKQLLKQMAAREGANAGKTPGGPQATPEAKPSRKRTKSQLRTGASLPRSSGTSPLTSSGG